LFELSCFDANQESMQCADLEQSGIYRRF